MSSGYIYCFQNECMPGLYKVGMTTREVEERLREANSTDTYKPPLPYTVALKKHVDNVREAEKFVHEYLESYGQRVNKKREFFRVSLDTIKKAFEMVDAEPDTCLICQEEGTVEKYLLENRDCTCKYFYHEQCFPPERRKRCPMCAREIKSRDGSRRQDHIAVAVRVAPMTVTRLMPTAPPPTIPNRVPLLSSRPVQNVVIAQDINTERSRRTMKIIIAGICMMGFISLMIIVIKYYG